MFGLGPREYVALGVLAIGGLLGFLFFDPTSTEGNDKAPATIHLGDPVTATPVVPPTATPVPVHTVARPKDQWLLTYYEKGVTGADVRSGEGFVDGLDFDIADRPFLDFKADAWSMQLTNKLETERGRNRFTLEVDGEAKVWVDGKLVAEAPNGNAAVRLAVEFEETAGFASVLIEVRDTGGPVKLRWVD